MAELDGDDSKSQPASFDIDGWKPADLESFDVNGRRFTLIDGDWERLDASIGAAAVAEEPRMPEWVSQKLESASELPKLSLTWPAEGTTVKDSYVVFSGTAEPGATVWAGPFSATADEDGNWSLGLVLSGGHNVATFKTAHEDGIGVKKSVSVYFESTEKDEGKDGDYHKPQDFGFDAWQKYGSCSEQVPYDVFKGKAAPGTTVTVTSPYGGGSAVAGDDGYWHVKVTFEAAPVGEAFTVTVSDGSETKTFTFTWKK